jgi:hypothetical protein
MDALLIATTRIARILRACTRLLLRGREDEEGHGKCDTAHDRGMHDRAPVVRNC